MRRIAIAKWASLADREPMFALVGNVELVVVRFDDDIAVLSGRCLRNSSLLVDGRIDGRTLRSGDNGGAYRLDSGIDEYDADVRLNKFSAWLDAGDVVVDGEEFDRWSEANPQTYNRDRFVGIFTQPYGVDAESMLQRESGRAARGNNVARPSTWTDVQLLPSQLSPFPLDPHAPVGTDVTIGPLAAEPLRLEVPVLIAPPDSNALTGEAQAALALGVADVGGGICSANHGALASERCIGEAFEPLNDDALAAADTASAWLFTATRTTVSRSSAWPSRQHLHDAIKQIRERTNRIPVGIRLAAQRIEADIDAALELGIDYLIIDTTGTTVPAVSPALALIRARAHLDRSARSAVTLIVQGGLRSAMDFTKALALGADAVAISSAAVSAVAPQVAPTVPFNIGVEPETVSGYMPLNIEQGAQQLGQFLARAVAAMQTNARSCGRHHVAELNRDDLVAFDRSIAELAGIVYGGSGGRR
ncbi:MAG: glutamate synthase-related protein [Pseudomonadota bacterium]